MFKKILILIVTTLTINIANASSMAVVNMQEILDNSLVIIDATKTLNKEKEEYQKKFSEKETNLTKEKDNLAARTSIMSQTDIQKEVELFQKKVADFQTEVRDTEVKLQQRMNNILSKVSYELKIIISEMLKEKEFAQYSNVVNSDAFLYFDSRNDITKDVLQRLNKKFKTLKSLEK